VLIIRFNNLIVKKSKYNHTTIIKLDVKKEICFSSNSIPEILRIVLMEQDFKKLRYPSSFESLGIHDRHNDSSIHEKFGGGEIQIVSILFHNRPSF
jgi:hypothetical protein